MTTEQEAAPPLVCTLSPAELMTRGLEWGDLRDLAVSTERIEGGVGSTYPIEWAVAVEDLANRESSCCGSWLNTATSRTSDQIRLELTTANPDGVDLIVSMVGPAR